MEIFFFHLTHGSSRRKNIHIMKRKRAHLSSCTFSGFHLHHQQSTKFQSFAFLLALRSFVWWLQAARSVIVNKMQENPKTQNQNLKYVIHHLQHEKKLLTPEGLVLFMKLDSWLDIDEGAEVGPSISTMSMLAGLEEPAAIAANPSEFPAAETCFNGSEAKAGGGPRGSVPGRVTGWFPNKFFSRPVCKAAKGQYGLDCHWIHNWLIHLTSYNQLMDNKLKCDPYYNHNLVCRR